MWEGPAEGDWLTSDWLIERVDMWWALSFCLQIHYFYLLLAAILPCKYSRCVCESVRVCEDGVGGGARWCEWPPLCVTWWLPCWWLSVTELHTSVVKTQTATGVEHLILLQQQRSVQAAATWLNISCRSDGDGAVNSFCQLDSSITAKFEL